MPYTVVLPLVGYRTKDMLRPLVLKNQSDLKTVGEIKGLILARNNHIDPNRFSLFLKGKYSLSEVGDKLSEDMTLRDVGKRVEDAHAREISMLGQEKLRSMEAFQTTQEYINELKKEIKKTERALTLSKRKCVKIEQNTKKLMNEALQRRQSDILEKMRTDRNHTETETKRLKKELSTLRRKAKIARERSADLKSQQSEQTKRIRKARLATIRFESSDKITITGVRINEAGIICSSLVKNLDLVATHARENRMNYEEKIRLLRIQLNRINDKISEIERKKSVIMLDRTRKEEEKRHLELDVQSSCVEKFDKLIKITKKMTRKAATRKTKIDRELAKLRLSLARGFDTTSHRDQSKSRRVKQNVNTGKVTALKGSRA
ncbi:hypothetical protein AAMO2058_001384900 [Amorphochlora amoebiformis]